MIELDRHIEILLLSNDCVIVPDLGGFTAHHIDARYDEADGMFVPPIRTLGFNPQLKLNDSLLVQSYIEAYDISYPEALRRIEAEVEELRSHIETTGEYELTDIGLLRLNDDGKLEFEPCEAGILTPELYGLSSFEMKPLEAEQKPADSESTDTAKLPGDDTITIKMTWLRNAVAVAAAVIAFLMIGTPISNSDLLQADLQQSSFINLQTPVTERQTASVQPTATVTETASAEAEEEVAAETQEASAEAEAATPETEVSTTALPANDVFCIVLASQVSERNALRFVEQLEAQGFTEARIMVSNNKVRRVVYGTYENESDAVSTQRQLRKESKFFRDTWVMEIKP